MRSVEPFYFALILLFFRIWRHPFLTFPSSTASINHHNFGMHPLFRWSLSKIELICDSLQAGGVFFDVVHLGYLRGAVAQQVGYLAR